jgi:hypothetical protein
MTGTLTISGTKAKKFEWDTDMPATYEAAKAAYDDARLSGLQAFAGAAGTETRRVDDPTMPEEDVTMVPRFAGGA